MNKNYELDDFCEVDIKHSCSSNRWKIIRIGADVKIKCMDCKKVITMSRYDFEQKLVRIIGIEDDSPLSNFLKSLNKKDILESDVSLLNVEFDHIIYALNHPDFKFKYRVLQIRRTSMTVEFLRNADIVGNINYYDLDLDKVKNISAAERDKKKRKSERNAKKRERKKIYKEELKLHEEDILKDKEWQKNHYGEVIEPNDLVLLKEDFKCPNCQKRLYKIMSLPKLLDKEIVLKCNSCLNYNQALFDDSGRIVDSINERIFPVLNYGISRKWDLIFQANFKNYEKTQIEIKCPNCGDSHAVLSVHDYKKNKYTLYCEKCEQVKSIKFNNRKDLYDAIEAVSFDEINAISNSMFESFDSHKNRVIRKPGIYTNIEKLIDNTEDFPIYKLQLIDSSNNHVTRFHKIINKVVNIMYIENGAYKYFEYKCHFCEDCHVYFDFAHSFLNQMEINGIELSKLVLQIIINDKYSNEVTLNDINCFETFQTESILHSYGYKVGYSGKSTQWRQGLLKKLYENNIMTIAEMKATINQDIRMFENRSGFDLALSEWQNDIEYLNNLIKK